MAGFEVRPLLEGDLGTVLALTHLVPEAPWWSERHIRQLTALRTSEPHFRRGWIAQESSPGHEGRVGGFVILQALQIACESGSLECEIESVVVHPELRRQGLGRTLLQAAVAWCQDQGACFVRLEVRSSNLPAIRLYESLCFVANGRRPRYYESPLEDALLMELRLPARG